MTTGQLAQRDVFLAEIRDDPDDDVPRLILGDWLADQGDPRGEFIQSDVRLASMAEGPERRELEERRRQLLAAHATEWLGPLLDVAAEWRWERGMLHITARSERLFGQGAPPVIGTPAFDWVEGVRLHRTAAVSHAWWQTLLSRISALNLYDDFRGSVARLLSYKAHLDGLRWLSLADNRISLEDVTLLAGCPHLQRLTRLDLSGNGLTNEAAQALIDSPCLTRLRALDLGGAHLSYAMRARLEERFGPGVVRLG